MARKRNKSQSNKSETVLSCEEVHEMGFLGNLTSFFPSSKVSRCYTFLNDILSSADLPLVFFFFLKVAIKD